MFVLSLVNLTAGYGSACIFWLSSGQKHSDVVAGLVPVIAIVSGTQRVEHGDRLLRTFGIVHSGILHPSW